MILIDEVLISDEIVSKNFCCDLEACKGACCWEGDLGAPLLREEVDIMEEEVPKIWKYLDDESQSILSEGVADQNEDELMTPLRGDESCVYLVGEGPIKKCAFEIAYEKGEISFRKPISCHLYPIRLYENNRIGFENMNFDEWDICSPATTKGNNEDITLLSFVKPALIRKYGEAFYNQLIDAQSKVNEEA